MAANRNCGAVSIHRDFQLASSPNLEGANRNVTMSHDTDTSKYIQRLRRKIIGSKRERKGLNQNGTGHDAQERCIIFIHVSNTFKKSISNIS